MTYVYLFYFLIILYQSYHVIISFYYNTIIVIAFQEEYKFLYEMAIQYMARFDMYANFQWFIINKLLSAIKLRD